MATRLGLYNGALRILGEPRLEALTDDVPIRYELDALWDGDFVKQVLEQGQWNFATRAARIEYDPDFTAEYGYRRRFEKPEDFVRTMGVCRDEYFREPLLDYLDEVGYWWSDVDELFVRFVSKGDTYGGDLSKWPESFASFVEAFLASECCALATYSDKQAEIENHMRRAKLEAQSLDAMEQPSKQPPKGSWASSRSRYGGATERGSRTRLIG